MEIITVVKKGQCGELVTYAYSTLQSASVYIVYTYFIVY